MIFSEIPYTRIDMDMLEADWLTAIDALNKAKTTKQALFALHALERPHRLFVSMAALSEIRHTMDTNDAQYLAEEAFFDTIKPQFEHLLEKRNTAVIDSPFVSALKKYISQEWLDQLVLDKETFNEEILPDLKEENRLSAAYTKLTANIYAEADGKHYTIAELVNLANSKDRATRKKYSNLQEQAYSKVSDELDDLFDQIVSVRHGMAKKLGFERFTDVGYRRMHRTGYGENETALFRHAVEKELVPVVMQLFKAQAKRLDVETLYYYDEPIDFPDGAIEPTVKFDTILTVFNDIFKEMSPQTHVFFNEFLANKNYDIELRDGKIMGAYSNFVPLTLQPFIFESFNNTPGALKTFAHECGHAFHSFLVAKEMFLANTECTMDLAEIHSMSMEFFIWPWLDKLYNAKDVKKHQFFHMKNALSFIPYGCAVDAFQHEVYENPKMSPKERRVLWQSLEKRFIPWRKYDTDTFLNQGRRWQMQTHIYKWPFYYIDYALAQTCAIQFCFIWQLDKDKAWQRYVKLLNESSKYDFNTAVNRAGLQTPFNAKHIKALAEKVKAWLENLRMEDGNE